jgi:hypothetical protein
MATQPAPTLPIFYKNLVPLSGMLHGKFKVRGKEVGSYVSNHHAIPVTVDEFILAQRFFPIVFSAADDPVPIALMGLNEGVNVFFDEEGQPRTQIYIPAYARRYPFMLAKMTPETPELSLCFDPDSDMVGEYDEGLALFEDGKATENLNNILKFCEDFEIAAQRTGDFVRELQKYDLLMDGEVSIQPDGAELPYVYRGFKMVDEERLRNLSGDQLSEIAKNGVFSLVQAHLFSMNLMRDVFGAQLALGLVPPHSELQQETPATVN